MCLQTKSIPGDIIRSCEPSKVLKGALVAYKVVDVNYTEKRIWIESLYLSKKIKAGWNKKQAKSLKIEVDDNHSYDHKPFSYPQGIHIYTSLESAQNRTFHTSFIVPVHFFKKDVLVEGKEIQNNFLQQDSQSVVVVTKYFLEKETANKTLNKAKKMWRIS